MTATIEHQSWRGDPAPGYPPAPEPTIIASAPAIVHRKVPDLAQYTPTEVLEAVERYLEGRPNQALSFIAYLHQGWFGDTR